MKQLYPAYELSWRTEEDEAFMRSAEWKRIRQAILVRDHFTCQYCGFTSEKGMNVGHIDGNPKNNSDANLEVVCPDCHKVMHAGLWVVVKGTMRLYRVSKCSQTEIIRRTREMRAEGKTDNEIISSLGLEQRMPWKQDLEYLRPLFAFILSGPARETHKPHLTEAEQRRAIKNRSKW